MARKVPGTNPATWPRALREDYLRWRGWLLSRATATAKVIAAIEKEPGYWAAFRRFGRYDKPEQAYQDVLNLASFHGPEFARRLKLPVISQPPAPWEKKGEGAAPSKPVTAFGISAAQIPEAAALTKRLRLAQGLAGLEADLEVSRRREAATRVAGPTDAEIDAAEARGDIAPGAAAIIKRTPIDAVLFGKSCRADDLSFAVQAYGRAQITEASKPPPRKSPKGIEERLAKLLPPEQLAAVKAFDDQGLLRWGVPAMEYELAKFNEIDLEGIRKDITSAQDLLRWTESQKSRQRILQAQRLSPRAEYYHKMIVQSGYDPGTLQAVYEESPTRYREIVLKYPGLPGLVFARYRDQEAWTDYEVWRSSRFSRQVAANFTPFERGEIAAIAGSYGVRAAGQFRAWGLPMHRRIDDQGVIEALTNLGRNVVPSQLIPMRVPLAAERPLYVPILVPRIKVPQARAAVAAALPTPRPPLEVTAAARREAAPAPGLAITAAARRERAPIEPWPLTTTALPTLRPRRVQVGQAASALLGAAYQTGIIPAQSPLGGLIGSAGAGQSVTSALLAVGVKSAIAGPLGVVMGLASFLGFSKSRREAKRAAARIRAANRAVAVRSQVAAQPFSRPAYKPPRKPTYPRRFMPLYPSRIGLAAQTMTPLARL